MQTKIIMILVVLLAIVSSAVAFWMFYERKVELKTEDQVVSFLKQKYSELDEYPSDNLAPKSIKSKKEGDTWYVAFIQEGSGRPIISAKCFTVDPDKTISQKEYIADISDDGLEFSPKNCSVANDPGDVVGTCEVENCHGLDISCGSNRADVCDEMYVLGDKCRQYATCGVENGTCKQVENPDFTFCKSCVETCNSKYSDNTEKLFECEGSCE